MSQNQKAFLDTIAWSEGTSTIAESDNGYNVLVGDTLFDSYADHPRQLVHLNAHLSSTAAGRYQLLAKYFDYYKNLLGLPDFSPDSQDQIALEQIKECHALPDIAIGNFSDAVQKCSHIWASLPGNNYGQHQNSIDALQEVYVNSGGSLA